MAPPTRQTGTKSQLRAQENLSTTYRAYFLDTGKTAVRVHNPSKICQSRGACYILVSSLVSMRWVPNHSISYAGSMMLFRLMMAPSA